MKKQSLSVCPVCGGQLKIVKYRCQSCGTEISGNFDICELCQLTSEQMEFLRVFLQTWGNFSEVARKLGISYPTVRQRYREILESLGYEVSDGETEEIDVSELIDKLERGELSVDEVLEKLRGYGND